MSLPVLEGQQHGGDVERMHRSLVGPGVLWAYGEDMAACSVSLGQPHGRLRSDSIPFTVLTGRPWVFTVPSDS